MITHLIYDQIDRLVLTPLARPFSWLLRFRSGHAGLHHQLYINGRLADFSDSPAQRTFEMISTDYPQELAITAVSGRYRTVDLSAELPADVQNPPWVLRTKFPRDIEHQPGDRLAIFHDSASGLMSEAASLESEIWPPSVSHWGFGQNQFGWGGFGIDGTSAPGLGGGSFGLGPFGLGADILETNLAMTNEGEHNVEFRVIADNGEISSALTATLMSAPPPQPVENFSITSYDSQTSLLTLQLS